MASGLAHLHPWHLSTCTPFLLSCRTPRLEIPDQLDSQLEVSFHLGTVLVCMEVVPRKMYVCTALECEFDTRVFDYTIMASTLWLVYAIS